MLGPLTLLVALLFSDPVPADTTWLEVGSPGVDGSVYKPHRARVRMHLNSLDSPPTSEWTNELTIGDSAGRRVARWVTLGQFDAQGNPGFDLRQTLDLVTMAPLGYRLVTRSGVDISLAIDGKRMYGTRKTPNRPDIEQVDQPVERLGFLASASDLVPLAVGLREGAVFGAPLWSPTMDAPEMRVFVVRAREDRVVEGHVWRPWKVDEFRRSDGRLMASWWLLDEAPYMVAGEIYLANGDVQMATEIPLP